MNLFYIAKYNVISLLNFTHWAYFATLALLLFNNNNLCDNVEMICTVKIMIAFCILKAIIFLMIKYDGVWY